MKKIYSIEVDCPNCALKVENAVKKIQGVTDANINYLTQKLAVEFTDDTTEKDLIKSIKKVGKKVDLGFDIFE